MISWSEFLSYKFGERGMDTWWTLGDEHINHMLIAMLITKDDDFLAEFVGHGPRKLEKWDFGGTFDLHVRGEDGLVLIEFKTWSAFSDKQKPPEAFNYMQKHEAKRIVYVLLTKKALENPKEWAPNENMKIVDLQTLISALEETKPEAPIHEIAIDYAAALRRLAPYFFGNSNTST